MLEEPRPVRPGRELLVLVGREAGRDELLDAPRVVDRRDHAVAGAGQRAGAVDHLLQDGVEVSRSRLALIRRTAALSLETRSCNASIRRCSSSALFFTGPTVGNVRATQLDAGRALGGP